MAANNGDSGANPGTGGLAEVFGAFLRLGCTSFGGPVAHIGFFHEEFVNRRKWLGERAFADLVALCQFLPGPASSQVGMGVGLARAGLPGMVAAWLGFTLPSALLMFGFGLGVLELGDRLGTGWLQGLKAVAVAVVAQAVRTMARSLCPDRARASLAVAATAVLLLAPSVWTQMAVIVGGALAGLVLARGDEEHAAESLGIRVPAALAIGALVLFFGLLFGLPLLAQAGSQPARLFEAFYRTGSLVFGGGHVVLPLLETAVVKPGWVDHEHFLAGYGAAQAVPGPLFTLSAYLGAISGPPPNGVAGAAIAIAGIFLSSFLLVFGMLPFWDRLRGLAPARKAMLGINAAVVGLLGAALYNPVFTGGITSPAHLALALAAYLALDAWKVPPWLVVVAGALVGGLAGL